MYEFEDVMGSYVRLWSILNMLPKKYIKSLKWQKWLRKINITFIHPLFYVINILPYFIVLAKVSRKGELDTQFIGELLFTIGFAARFIIICLNQRKFAHILKECHSLWKYLYNDDEILIIRSYEKMLSFFRAYLLGSTWMTIISYSISAQFVYYMDDDKINATAYRKLPILYVNHIILIILLRGGWRELKQSALPTPSSFCYSFLRVGPDELKHSVLPTPWDFYYQLLKKSKKYFEKRRTSDPRKWIKDLVKKI